jgi:hypothetical protein
MLHFSHKTNRVSECDIKIGFHQMNVTLPHKKRFLHFPMRIKKLLHFPHETIECSIRKKKELISQSNLTNHWLGQENQLVSEKKQHC